MDVSTARGLALESEVYIDCVAGEGIGKKKGYFQGDMTVQVTKIDNSFSPIFYLGAMLHIEIRYLEPKTN